MSDAGRSSRVNWVNLAVVNLASELRPGKLGRLVKIDCQSGYADYADSSDGATTDEAARPDEVMEPIDLLLVVSINPRPNGSPRRRRW